VCVVAAVNGGLYLTVACWSVATRLEAVRERGRDVPAGQVCHQAAAAGGSGGAAGGRDYPAAGESSTGRMRTEQGARTAGGE